MWVYGSRDQGTLNPKLVGLGIYGSRDLWPSLALAYHAVRPTPGSTIVGFFGACSDSSALQYRPCRADACKTVWWQQRCAAHGFVKPWASLSGELNQGLGFRVWGLGV